MIGACRKRKLLRDRQPVKRHKFIRDGDGLGNLDKALTEISNFADEFKAVSVSIADNLTVKDYDSEDLIPNDEIVSLDTGNEFDLEAVVPVDLPLFQDQDHAAVIPLSFTYDSEDSEDDEEEKTNGYRVDDTDGALRVFVSGNEIHTDTFFSKYVERSDAQTKVKDCLTKQGLLAHLQSTIGGSVKWADAMQVIVRVAGCLSWTYWRANGQTEFPLRPDEAIGWFHTLIVKKYKLITPFCKHLDEARKLSASTVLNNLNAMSAGAKWLIFFAELIDSVPSDGAAFQEVLKQHRKLFQKKKAQAKGDFSIQAAVADRSWPAGGIQELQEICKQAIEEFMRLHGHKDPFEIDRKTYRQLFYLIFSSMFTSAAQGRKSGVADVREYQYADLDDIGYALSKNFKTSVSHKYQAIINTVQTKPLLHLGHHWRPRAVWNKQQKDPEAAVPEHLFLDFDGEVIGDKVGEYVTRFFRSHGLHMTTTTLRSLMETTADQYEKAGMITHEQRLAVSSINTHSSRITQDYYVRSDIDKDVHLARLAMSPLLSPEESRGFASTQGQFDASVGLFLPSPLGNIPSSTQGQFESPVGPFAPSPVCSHFPPPCRDLVMPVLGWGIKHPDYQKFSAKSGKPVTRAEWSPAELEYMGRWYHDFRQENPDLQRMSSIFLSHLKKDKAAIGIFHTIHTLDSKRIRYGFDAAKRLGYLSGFGGV